MTAPILITGAGTRLGLALAHAYLDDAQPVIATYRSARPELDALAERGAHLLYADFSTDEGVETAVASLVDACPQLTSIVHNASSWEKDSDGAENLDILARMMRIHVGAPMRITDALAPALLKSPCASVVNVSDHVANRGSDQHMAYAASKAALLNLTKSQAKKYAPDIRVNALCPALLAFRPEDDAGYREKALSKSPLGIEPGFEVAIEAIRYLQSNRYTTGVVLPLDGGRPLKMP